MSHTLFAVVVLLAAASVVTAQNFRARIQGTIADSSDAVIPAATVILLNTRTGVRTERQSNENGIYLFDYVPSGWYSLTVELEGFNKFIQENIEVQAAGDITVNVTLQPGAITESITVEESPVAVQFNSTNTNLTIDTKIVNELPRFDRNPFKLSLLNPSAINTRGEMNPFHSWAANSVELGGGTNLANDLQVDGSPIGIGHKAGYAPPPDAVQEVNVQQNSIDAESGHSAGGVISMTMKSGTNDWHGNIYYLHRNPALNAVTDRTTGSKSASRNHIYGGTLGNAIIKNKLFNFFSYEAWRPIDPLNYIRTMATPAERSGDFSKTLNINGGVKTIYDPWTTVFDAANNKATRTPYPGNIIPAQNFDPVSASLVKQLWDPNGPGENITGKNNFKTTINRTTKYWNLSDRVDWSVNDSVRVFGRYSYLHTMIDADDPTPNQSQLYVTQGASARHALSVAGDVVWTITPTTVFNIHGDYHHLVDDYDSPRDKLGEEGFGAIWPHSDWYQPYAGELPPYVPGFQMGGSRLGVQAVYWYQHPNGSAINAKLAQQRGAHYMKFGFDTRRSGGETQVARTTLFRFDADVTADTFISPKTNVVGHEYATFLIGALKNNTQAIIKPIKTPRNSFYALFFQDDWKLSRRVTLNLGIRWEYETAWSDPEYRMSKGLNLNVPFEEMQANPPNMPPAALDIMGSYNYKGAWVFTSKDSPGMWNAPKWNFMPRAGIAFRADDKTAIRFGYARYQIPTEFNFNTAISGFEAVNFLEPPYFGYDAAQSPPGLLQGIPQAVVYDPFPVNSNPLIPAKGKDFGKYLGAGGTNLLWYHQDMERGINDRLSFSVQRSLPGDVVLDVTYFLNIGSNWDYSLPLNAMDPRLSFEYQAQLAKSVPNPFYNYLTPDVFPGPLRNQKNVALSTLLKPQPQYGGLMELYNPEVSERYHSLNFRVQRSFRNGFNFLFGYVYLRESMDEMYDDVDNYLGNFTWQESAQPRHRFSVAGIYELPFGRGRQYLSEMHPVLDGIVGGWQVAPVWYFNSGDYLRFGAMEATGDPTLENPTPQRWFDTSKLSQLPPYTRRSNPLQYPSLTGPSYWVIDASISKQFRIGERFRTELKMGAYNATNRLNRTNPDMGVLSSTFGQSLRQRTSTGRQLEIGLKIIF